MNTFIHTFKQQPLFLRLLTLSLIIGGGTGGIANFLLLAGFWPWSMPALAHRFLAGAAAAYVVGGLIALTRPRWNESEFLNLTVLIYGVALLAAILLQINLIDWTQPVAWLFVAVVSFAFVVVLYYFWQRRGSVQKDAAQTLGVPLRTFLIILGVAATGVGALVYIIPQQAGFIWPWSALSTWKLLDSRLIASMLLTVGGGAFFVWWRDDRGVMQVLIPMVWAYCLVAGTGIALHALDPKTPLALVMPDYTYVVIFTLLAAISLILFVQESKRANQRN